MTLSEILKNEPLRRREFPVVEKGVFLAHAAVCPLPRRVTEAMSGYLEQTLHADQEKAFPQLLMQQLRDQASRLLNVQSTEIALVGPTSLALSFVAAGLSLRSGDNLVYYQDDYPSNVYPWMSWREKGVELRPLQTSGLGCIQLKDVAARVDDHTRLVALSSCHFISGDVLDLKEIGSFLRERDIRFCVDGIQTMGAIPTDASHADFLAADAHKWQLGPCSAGVLYVRREVQEELKPTTYGWHNVRCPDFVAQPEISFRPDARRYEAGTANLVGLVGLKAAWDLIEEIGVDCIAEELRRKRAWVMSALKEKGFTILGGEGDEKGAGGILSFYDPKRDLPALHARLADENVTVSLRTSRGDKQYLRISPHFYNTDEELDRFLKSL